MNVDTAINRQSIRTKSAVLLVILPVIVFLFWEHNRNSVQAENFSNTFTVTNTNDSGAGSLRQSLLDANANPGIDTVNFSLGTGPYIISVSSALPNITDAILIDGSTGNSTVPRVEITSPGQAAVNDGLHLVGGSNGSTIKSLLMSNIGLFSTIQIESSGNSIIDCELIGGTIAIYINGNALTAANNTIGGTGAASRNYLGVKASDLSDFGNVTGVLLRGAGAHDNKVQGNICSAANDCISIVDAPDNLIGGTLPGARNVLGNSGFGINISASGTTVQGNYIGLADDGVTPRPVRNAGVLINGANNLIGGNSPAARNVISRTTNTPDEDGNPVGGAVYLLSSATVNNRVQGNYIGTDAGGTLNRGNLSTGVLLRSASGNLIGGAGAGEGNLIAYNNAGILVQDDFGAAVNNALLGNEITGNLKLGIDLIQPGEIMPVTPNDACDPDTGPNNLQNFPVLTSADSSGGQLSIQGSLDSLASTSYRVEFFACPTCDASGNGEGERYLGATNVMTNSGCSAAINVTLPVSVEPGQVITATASLLSGSIPVETSEFSTCRMVTGFGCPTITVMPVAPELPFGRLDASYTQNFTANGGNGAVSFSVSAGTLPPGLTLSANGALTGTPSATGNFSFTIKASDANNCMGIRPYTLTIFSNRLVVTTVNDVVNAADGFCSLREAVVSANTNTASGAGANECAPGFAGLDQIQFALGLGTPTINLAAGLPDITEPVLIDGATGGANRIALHATTAGYDGLRITAGGSTVKSLVINGFSSGMAGGGVGIRLLVNGGNTVQNCYIGTDIFGLGQSSNVLGIQIISNNNIIGGTVPGDRNLISGNSGNGISINGADNRVQGNFIGTNVNGASAIGNGLASGLYGVAITGANNTIGGTATGAGNLISGNNAGIALGGPATTGNLVQGNLIGTDVSGTARLGNLASGVSFQIGAANNTIGGTTASERNIISANGASGIFIGLSGVASHDNRILGNYIGTDISGLADLGNTLNGIQINSGSTGNFIGGTTVAERNVISGNDQNGVSLESGNNTGNHILGNYIGISSNGNVALRNTFSGIRIRAGSTGNFIGNSDGSGRNIISGNGVDGITLGASGNQVLGNFIGTNASGTADLGNSGHGVSAEASGNIIGGTAAGERNIISGNDQQGVALGLSSTISNVQVLGNYIGTDVTGNNDLGNSQNGVWIVGGASNCVIGGTIAGAANVISGNDRDGVNIGGGGNTGNQILGNFIGTNANGNAALANTNSGVALTGAAVTGNSIGNSDGSGRNIISANGRQGVFINANGNQVLGNYIGTDINGTLDLGNSESGVYVNNAANNLIGGTAGNVISGNNQNGVLIEGASSSGNLLQGNFIGTDAAGTAALRNEINGVYVLNAPTNTIGGLTNEARNIISGGNTTGVQIQGSASTGNLVQGNFIGTDVSGTNGLGNRIQGIGINNAPNTTIGGTGGRNIISGNGARGIRLDGVTTPGYRVLGNFIGTDVNGLTAVPNGALGAEGDGIQLFDAGNVVIGGLTPGERNLISGNLRAGISLFGTNSQILGNFIGTDINGTGNLGNGTDGISIFGGTNNLIGTSGGRNTIAFNRRAGILVLESLAQPARGNRFSSNSIFSNAQIGIDLSLTGSVFVGGDGVTANDPADPDTGPNLLQNFPVLDSITTPGTVTGTLDSMASNSAYPIRLEFFANADCDSEGQKYLGFLTLNAPGAFAFNHTPEPGLNFISATATDNAGNTSEFTPCRTTSAQRAPFDFDGDNKTDISIFRPAPAEWWYLKSSTGGNFAAQFGNSADKIVPADFTGDGKTDIAVWRPSTGVWFVLRSEDSSFYSFPFGSAGDIPAPADYDGDGTADPAVFRPSTATWFILRSTGGTTITSFGIAGDQPVPADYDGDGKADLAIYRPALGQWWINRSTAGLIVATFGISTDKPVQGDYTGDGKADVAFWRNSTGEWFVLRSEDSSFFSFPFGTSGDSPVAGDYDGDGKFDAAIFRPSSTNWFIQRSTAGTLILQFGIAGDLPVPNAFVP